MALSDRQASHTPRSFAGCWTCRLRRKKCDERRLVCETCASLYLTCHFGPEKPEWMDGGARQELMAARFKQEVREGAQRRREGRAVDAAAGDFTGVDVTTDDVTSSSARENDSSEELSSQSQQQEASSGSHCALLNRDDQDGMRFGQSDTVLITLYLETVMPFLFPFYQPSIIQGGRAWVLEMMLNSPVVRRATLCLSPYFLSLVRDDNTTTTDANMIENENEKSSKDALWDAALLQTRDAFVTLGQALQVINNSGIKDHLHGAVRIMASIVQLQRFEITVLGFDNCRSHHNAALALFEQILDSANSNSSNDEVTATEVHARFKDVLHRLGASSSPNYSSSTQQFVQISSAEQTAFRFSSALVLHNDIIASTILQERPKLYEYHVSLLNNNKENDSAPYINLETITGCQNWVHLQIAEIAVLDAWKQQCKRAGDLDVMELVRRAADIKSSLSSGLERLKNEMYSTDYPQDENEGLLDLLTKETGDNNYSLISLSEGRQLTGLLVTGAWAHAAMLYLSIVVSGWQPANSEVRHHLSCIFDVLFSSHTFPSFQARLPPLLMRTMAWPFCVAGCLAEPAKEGPFRKLVEKLKPPSAFGTVYKALEIMERAWRNRSAGDSADKDLASCFRCEENLVLLV